MTTLQIIILFMLTGFLWIGFQVVMEITRGRIMMQRQEQMAGKMYELACRYIVKAIRDIREVRKDLF